MRLKAADTVIDAELSVDLANLLTRGTVKAAVPDLTPWSRLVGTPLAGRLDATARLDSRAGQMLDLTISGDRVSSAVGGSRVTVGHHAATARLNDLLGTPFGTGRTTMTGVTFPSGDLSNATLTLDSPRPGRFALVPRPRASLSTRSRCRSPAPGNSLQTALRSISGCRGWPERSALSGSS